MSELLTTPAPRPAHPPVQRVAEVLGSRPVNAYTELRLAAPEIAATAAPGQFVAFAIGGASSALLLRRSIAIAGTADGVVTVVVAAHGPGSTWLAGLQPGTSSTSSGRSAGRSRCRRRARPRCSSAGDTVPRRWSAWPSSCATTGSRVTAIAGAASADRLCSVDELGAVADEVVVTTDDGSAGRAGWVSDPAGELVGQVGIVYACGPMGMLRAVGELATAAGVPSYVAVEESMACGIGVCMTCVLPVIGEDGRTRFARSCAEGPIFGGDRVRFADVGRLPA